MSRKPMKVERLKPVKKGKYNSTEAMIRDLTEDKEFAEEMIREIRARSLIDMLMAQRALAGLSQQDIAKRMKCTQSRISKLESGDDAELTIGTLLDYAAALGLETRIELSRRDDNGDLVPSPKERVPVTRQSFVFEASC